MRRLFLTVLILFFSPAIWADTLPVYSKVYDPARDPFADGRDAIAQAKDSCRHVLIEVGGNWCTWCHVLEDIFQKHPEIQHSLRKHYVVLKVNVSEDNDNAAFMKGLPKLQGYPQLFIADGDGNIIHAQDPAQFLHVGTYHPGKVHSFLLRWSPTGVSTP